jgi:ribosomal subunit interface protein
MQIDIYAPHVEIHPQWRVIIQRRAVKLTEFSKDIVRLHVTLVHNPHHQFGREEVRLLTTVPNGAFRVHKVRPNMGDAINAAFAALERELVGFLTRRKTPPKEARARRSLSAV